MSAAHVYLRKLMEKYDENAPWGTEEIAEMRREFHMLLDKDMVEAKSDGEQLKLTALAAGATHAFDSFVGNPSEVNLRIFNNLVSIATGVRGENLLRPKKQRTRQRTAQEDWELARGIVAMNDPSLRERAGFEVWLKARTGRTEKEMRKLVDNMDQERGSYDIVKVNIKDINKRVEKGEVWLFDDLK